MNHYPKTGPLIHDFRLDPGTAGKDSKLNREVSLSAGALLSVSTLAGALPYVGETELGVLSADTSQAESGRDISLATSP